MEKMPKSESEWKKKLSPEKYAVLRQKHTEAPFTGKLLHSKEKGTYMCGACGNKLFPSDVKFDSGTGWPSFSEAIPGAIELKEDFSHGMRRTEVLCARCKSHLGHLFLDGPMPNKKRFCINSCALDLKKQ